MKKFWKPIIQFLIIMAIGCGIIILTARIASDFRKEEIKQATIVGFNSCLAEIKNLLTPNKL